MTHEPCILSWDRESCQIDVFLVLIFSLSRAGLDGPFDPQAHARLPRVELRDLFT